MVSLRESVVREYKKKFQELNEEFKSKIIENPQNLEYLLEQQQGLQGVEASDTSELYVDLELAEIVYVGDINILRGLKNNFKDLVEFCKDDESIQVIALPDFTPEEQSQINNYLSGKLSLKRLRRKTKRKKIPHQEGLEEILKFAKEEGVFVFGIGREKYENYQEKDEILAEEIAGLVKDFDNAQIFVLAGNEHLDRRHLPGKVADKVGYKQEVVIFQSEEEIFWQLMEKGEEYSSIVTKLGERTYAFNNTPPLLKAITYLNAEGLNSWKVTRSEIVEEYFNQLREVIRKGLGLEEGYYDSVVVFTERESLLERIQDTAAYKRGEISNEKMEMFAEQEKKARSFYAPQSGFVYLATMETKEIAEEATHSLMLRRKKIDTEGDDFFIEHFYSRIIEEALGYIGAKTLDTGLSIYPISPYVSPESFRAMITTIGILPYLEGIDDLLPEDWQSLSTTMTPETVEFDYVSHYLGQSLGEGIHKLVEKGKMDKDEFVKLFERDFLENKNAMETYNFLIRRVKSM